jgi:hypothetical protein
MAEGNQPDDARSDGPPRWVILGGRMEYATDEDLLAAVAEHERAVKAAIEHVRRLEASAHPEGGTTSQSGASNG